MTQDSTTTAATSTTKQYIPGSSESPTLRSALPMPMPPSKAQPVTTGLTPPGEALTHGTAVEERLIVMWRETSNSSKATSMSQKKSKELKTKLAEALFNYKNDLVGHGREGRWFPFLRDAGIPLSTADRYVDRHRRSLNPTKKLLTGELTADDIERLGKKICIMLSRATTKNSRIALLKRIDLKLRELRG